ncbi:hypothetical protein E2C01_006894 [Portunus trituberculatus]|uniref:Uncharacterized protein n=1 Tax=Portunus trituberculatus TaxID=210409 RepID=A0A5B7CWC3_PORTR|nr:hypothetical protein [Portunus trituberculatus]
MHPKFEKLFRVQKMTVLVKPAEREEYSVVWENTQTHLQRQSLCPPPDHQAMEILCMSTDSEPVSKTIAEWNKQLPSAATVTGV